MRKRNPKCKRKKEAPKPETQELENISKDEIEIVREANNEDESETAINRGLRTTDSAVSSTNEKQDDPKGDDRDTPAEAREAGDFQMILANTKLFAPVAVFKSIGTGSLNKPCVIHTRPPSGRSDGIHKLDILMSESREKMKSESTTRGQNVSE